MDFVEWMKQQPAGKAAVLFGGDVQTFDKICTFDFGRAAEIVCMRDELGRISSDTDLPFLPMVTARTPDSLKHFSQSRGADILTKITFVTAEMIKSFLGSEIRVYRRHADMLSGYDTPLPIIEAAATLELKVVLDRLLAKAEDFIVLHDPDGKSGLEDNDTTSTFNIFPELTQSTSAAPLDEPTIAQVLLHANFLDQTDTQTLHAMHDPLNRPGCDAIFNFWRNNLMIYQNSDSHGDIAQAALSKLETIIGKLDKMRS